MYFFSDFGETRVGDAGTADKRQRAEVQTLTSECHHRQIGDFVGVFQDQVFQGFPVF